ncbi:carboxypeptidase N subunit 2-like [Ixodes scapularis]
MEGGLVGLLLVACFRGASPRSPPCAAGQSCRELRAAGGRSLLIVGNASVLDDDLIEDPFLEKVTFSDGCLEDAWGTVSRLRKLRAFELIRVTNLHLSRDFNQLPPSVDTISIQDSEIKRADPGWISELRDIAKVIIENSALKTFEMSMLSRPAKKLWLLNLKRNHLCSLPRDFGNDFPALIEVDVTGNQITTLDGSSLLPFLQASRRIIKVHENPLDCDCRVSFLMNITDSSVQGYCNTPPRLSGRGLDTLMAPDLHCYFP